MPGTRFVVQLHDATTLHFDLRIQVGHTLHGSKLAGGFALTRTGEHRWILVKTKDAAAHPGSDIVAERPASVRTGKTWEEVAREAGG